MRDATDRDLSRALGSRTSAGRLAALADATGRPVPDRGLRDALESLDRTDPAAVWASLAILLGELPTAQTVTDFRRWATLEGSAAAMVRAARATRRLTRRRPIPLVVPDARILVGAVPSGPGIVSADWSRDRRTLVADGRVIVPVRSTVVVVGIVDHAGSADRLGTAAAASVNRFVAPAVGTAPLANEPGGPLTAATWATHLSCLAQFSMLVAPDEVVAADTRGWASMLPGLGLVGPSVTVAAGASVERLFAAASVE